MFWVFIIGVLQYQSIIRYVVIVKYHYDGYEKMFLDEY